MKNFNQALSYAFLLLRYRPRVEKEVRRRLKEKGFSLFAVEKTVTFLKERGYLNEEEFLRSYLETSEAKGWGPLKVNFNLKRIGLSVKLRKEAVRESRKQSDKLIKKILEKKAYLLKETSSELNKKKVKAKIIRFLSNRGFYYKDIYDHLNKL